MIVRAAAGGIIHSHNTDDDIDTNVISLQRQLKDLDMAEMMSEAISPHVMPSDTEGVKKVRKCTTYHIICRNKYKYTFYI